MDHGDTERVYSYEGKPSCKCATGVSASTMTLIDEQPNVMQVFEFRETPEPMIILDYYSEGNIVDAGDIDDERYVSALGQILDGLSHLHAKEVAHRDLKPQDFLVKKKPFFKVVITDFGLSKVVTTLLTTFCGTLKYLAPEVFPGVSDGHGPEVDIWSLGVIVLEWIYGIPTSPSTPKPEKNGTEVLPKQWYDWVLNWSAQLLNKLDDEDNGQVVEILLRMIEIKVRKRWHAKKCLAQGFENSLFKRRQVDGLVVCTSDPDDLVLPTKEGDDGTKTPTAASPSIGASLLQSQVDNDTEATIILEKLWDDGGSANSH